MPDYRPQFKEQALGQRLLAHRAGLAKLRRRTGFCKATRFTLPYNAPQVPPAKAGACAQNGADL